MFRCRASSLLLSLLLLAGCVHRPRPLVPPPPPPAREVDETVLPFAKVLDSSFAASDPAFSARLGAMDAGGDRDGVFTRGDAWAAGESTQIFTDLHIHPFMAYALRPWFRGMPDSKRIARSPTTILRTQVTLPALRRGATNVLFASVYVGATHVTRRGRLREALKQIEVARKFVREHSGEMEIALTGEDVRRIVAAKKIAIVLSVEGAHVLGRPEDVDLLYGDGVRMMTITHFTDNGVAGSAFSTLSHPENFHWFGRHHREDHTVLNRNGLTPFGAKVVRRMTEVGMIVDLAHASDASVRDVLALTADRPVPLVISHTAMRAYHPAERNESDALVRDVAARGGVVALSSWRVELDAKGIDECHAFATHFRRLLEIAGPEHVGIGTDFNGLVMRPRPCGGKNATGIRRTGLRNVGDMPELLQSLVDEGVPAHVVESMGANMVRVLDDVERLRTTSPAKSAEVAP